jgi:DNA-binding LytR/AlgR family response regulator
MIKIAVVDDEEIFCNKLQQGINEFLKNRKVQCQISMFTHPIKFLKEHNQKPFDLIYLDIDMPDKNGIELAADIRKNKTDTHLIFVSSHSHFVFDTFQYAPYRFIRKEKLVQELPESLDSYCKELCQEKLLLKLKLENNKEIEEEPAHIRFFFSIRHDIFLCRNYCQHERLANRAYTMEQLEEIMKPYGFIRIHKTYLVNYRCIYQIHDSSVILIPDNEQESHILPLSSRRLSQVKMQYQILMRDGDAL